MTLSRYGSTSAGTPGRFGVEGEILDASARVDDLTPDLQLPENLARPAVIALMLLGDMSSDCRPGAPLFGSRNLRTASLDGADPAAEPPIPARAAGFANAIIRLNGATAGGSILSNDGLERVFQMRRECNRARNRTCDLAGLWTETPLEVGSNVKLAA